MTEVTHPFGLRLSDDQISLAISMVRKLYLNLPETTCKGHAECCKAGCPNMHYCEYLSIRHGYIQNLDPEKRKQLIWDCVRLYLTKQITAEGKINSKPCVLLEGNRCIAYEFRHFKCRLYGLIPKSIYKENAQAVADDLKMPLDQIPLCEQCPFVEVKENAENKFPENKVPKQMVLDLEKAIRDIDRIALRIPESFQQKGLTYLTFHDWHLMFELGEAWMANLTPLREKLTDSQKDEFIAALKKSLGTL